MKKVLLIAALAVFGLSVAQAQEGFKVGATAALPVGDADDFTTFGFGLDASYLWEVGSGFLVGATAGYHHFFGDDIEEFGFTFEVDDFQFIPLAASARYYFTDDFFAGADLGYALGINDGNDGGFYYRPKIGYDLGPVAIHASFAGVSADLDDGESIDFNYIGLGVEIGF
jgi:hypothetical protein